jgi:hypothetical protein
MFETNRHHNHWSRLKSDEGVKAPTYFLFALTDIELLRVSLIKVRNDD